MFQGTLSNALESLIREILRSSCSQIIKYKYEEYAHSPTELTCDSSLHVLIPEENLMCSQLEITWEFCLATAFAKWPLLPHFTNVVFITIRCFLAPFFAQNFYVVLEPFILFLAG